MDTIISYDEIAALVANPPSLASRPNFINLHNLRRHIQRALMRVSCPQSNILGWAGLIMSREMYGLLTTIPFRLQLDPGLLAIYYPPKIPIVDAQGDPVLDATGKPTYQSQPAIRRAEQSTIDASFKRGENYWKSYINIQCAVFNCLDDGIDCAFKVSNNPALTGGLRQWNQGKCSTKSRQHTGAQHLQPSSKTICYFEACIPLKMPPKYYSGALKIAKKYRS